MKPLHIPKPAQIWVDADAYPAVIRDILFRAAARTGTAATLVANHYLSTPTLHHVRAIQVPGGPDAADDAIAERVAAGDLLVTQDIPLAARVLEAGATAVARAANRSPATPSRSACRSEASWKSYAVQASPPADRRPCMRAIAKSLPHSCIAGSPRNHAHRCDTGCMTYDEWTRRVS